MSVCAVFVVGAKAPQSTHLRGGGGAEESKRLAESTASLPRSRNVVGVEAVDQRPPGDAQQARGHDLVAIGSRQGLDDAASLVLRELLPELLGAGGRVHRRIQ